MLRPELGIALNNQVETLIRSAQAVQCESLPPGDTLGINKLSRLHQKFCSMGESVETLTGALAYRKLLNKIAKVEMNIARLDGSLDRLLVKRADAMKSLLLEHVGSKCNTVDILKMYQEVASQRSSWLSWTWSFFAPRSYRTHVYPNEKIYIELPFLIGEGFSKKVFFGIDYGSNQLVAVARGATQIRSNITNEVSILSDIPKHPHIAGIKKVISFASITQGYISRFFNHKSTAELKRTAPDSLLQVLRGIEHLHASEIVHNDIKKDNILSEEIPSISGHIFQRYALGDFDRAESFEAFSSSRTHGALGCIAPEVVEQNKRYPGKNDLYALGIIIARLYGFHSPGINVVGIHDFTFTQAPPKNSPARLIESLLRFCPPLRPAVSKIEKTIAQTDWKQEVDWTNIKYEYSVIPMTIF